MASSGPPGRTNVASSSRAAERLDGRPPRANGAARSSTARFLVRSLGPLWVILLLVGLWQAWVSVFGIDRLVMPGPRDVFSEFVSNPTRYLPDLVTTVKHAGIGLVLGTALGLALAVASWFSPLLGGMVSVPAILLRATPIAALTPVIARMFGYNENSVIAVAVLISFFPTYVFVATGLRAASSISDDLFSVLHAGRLTRLRHLALPAAAPSLLLALRVSAPIAVLGALVAEWLIGVKGLGALLSISRFTYQVSIVWAGAILGTLLGVVTFAAASKLERIGVERWT
ncbi:MAG TPA: ABC transporter permease subunit [Actinomycetes bacterium]|nr:ABC transporter permease subunit [Actinomycetes bacterium]